MYTENYDQWFRANKNFAAPISELNKVTTEFCQRIAQQNVEIIGDNFSLMSEQLKRLTQVRKPEDFVNLQKECFNEDMSAFVENMQKIIHISMQNVQEFTKLYGNMRETTATATKSSDRK